MLSAHRAAVLGSSIAHSPSPALHRAAYRALGLDNWSYAAQEVTADRLPGLLAGTGPEWAGLSLTLPLQEVALAAAEQASDLARRVGAANTLVRLPEGGWRAENTDVYGVTAALREAGLVAAEQAVVVGSGATARAVMAALADLGCQRVTFVSRGPACPQALELAAALGLQARVCRPEAAAGPLAEAAVVVSTTPTGADLPLAVPRMWTVPPIVLDVDYAAWPTGFARAFRRRGAEVVWGFEVLLHQAAAQVLLMTGLPAPVEAMRTAGLDAMSEALTRKQESGAAVAEPARR